MTDIKRRTVFITGASSGFGLAMARRFHAEGWNVAATMRTPQRSPVAPDDRLITPRLDVQDGRSIDGAVAETVARFGTLDAVINNAGFSMFGVFEEIPRARMQEQLDVNLVGPLDVIRAVLPTMRRQRSGLLINITSGAGIYAVPMLSAYCATKFALEGFSEALAYELASVGIIVKLVEPGAVLTTSFASRAVIEAATTTPVEDYAAFRAAMGRMFAGQGQVAGLATAEDVAATTFAAATDGTRRLRYLVGRDIVPFVEARQQTSEDAYLALMRRTFEGPTGT